MGTHHSKLSNALILSATIALTSSLAYAGETIAPQGATIVAAASNAGRATSVASGDAADFPSSEAGVRKAAAEGPESLRRYVQRTRMIYNYSYWSFAKEQ